MTKQYFTLLTIFPLFLGMLFLLSIGIQTNYSAAQSEEVVVQKQDLLYTFEPLTQAQLEECETLYDDYTNLAENLFTQRYLYHKFVGNCVMLFDDPVWNTKSPNRYDKLSERLTMLVQEREQMVTQRLLEAMQIEPMGVIELEDGLYLFTFEGCTGNQPLKLQDIFVASDKEAISLVTPEREGTVLPPGICSVLDIRIHAEDPESIRVVLPSMIMERQMEKEMGMEMKSKMMSPRAQMKLGTPSDQVQCREGLDLIFKATDDSPACVKPKTAEKLIERGWAAS